MSGIFDYHVKESGVNTKSYYQNIQKCMKECAKKTGKYQLLFSFYEKLAAVLADKADLGMCIKSAYRFYTGNQNYSHRMVLVSFFAVTNQLQLHYRI